MAYESKFKRDDIDELFRAILLLEDEEDCYRIGIISAGISVGISALLYQKIIDVIGAQVFSVLSMPMVPVGFLTYNFAWIFLALGISIGACGSIISMRKFLDA